jgi:hypothetical protein
MSRTVVNILPLVRWALTCNFTLLLPLAHWIGLPTWQEKIRRGKVKRVAAAAAAAADKDGVCCRFRGSSGTSGAKRSRKASPWDVLSAAGGGVWSVTCQVFQARAIYGFGLGSTRLAGILVVLVSLSPSKTTIRTLTVTLRPIRFLGSVTRDDNLLRMSATCGGVEQAIPHAPPQTSTAPNKPWGLEEGRRRQTPNSCCWWRQREAPGVSTTY